MAVKYVDSNAAGAANGDNWTDAYADVATGLTNVAAGDTIYVASDHAESSAAITWGAVTSSATNPVWIISADKTSGTPPSTFTLGAEEVSTNTFTMTGNHGHIVIGLRLVADNDFTISQNDGYYHYINCDIEQTDVVSTRFIGINGDDTVCICDGVQFSFSHASQYLRQALQGGRAFLRNCSIKGGSTAINELIDFVNTRGTQTEIIGCDFSGMATGGDIVGSGGLPTGINGGQGTFYRISGCKLPTTGVINGASFVEHGSRIEAYDFGIGTSTVPSVHIEDYRGLTVEDTATYRTATYDGASNYSLYATATTQSVRGVLPHRFLLSEFYAAANPTLTCEFMSDGAVTFDAADLWIEVEYPTASSAGTSWASTVDADYGLGTASSLTAGAGAAAWTGEPASSTSYRIAHTVSGGRAGVHRVYVNFAPGAAEAVFCDPHVDIT